MSNISGSEDLSFQINNIEDYCKEIDAEIAEYIINHFTDRGTPVLAIHDSFLINRIYEGDLKTVMQTACREIPVRLFNQSVKKQR